jgi:hypothetical protein
MTEAGANAARRMFVFMNRRNGLFVSGTDYRAGPDKKRQILCGPSVGDGYGVRTPLLIPEVDLELETRRRGINPATYEVVAVNNKASGDLLGYIRWYSPWRQYCFFPHSDTVYSAGCLNDINNFIHFLGEEITICEACFKETIIPALRASGSCLCIDKRERRSAKGDE